MVSSTDLKKESPKKKNFNQLIDKFKKFQAQIVPNPLSIKVVKAEGSYVYEKNKKYLDFVAGVSVCNIGHSNKKVFRASVSPH